MCSTRSPSSFIGEEDAEAIATDSEALTDDEKALLENTNKISAAFPAAKELAKFEARQLAFAKKLTRAALKRTEAAEMAIRNFGLNPDKLAANLGNDTAMGGPLIPLFSGDDEIHPTLERLSNALQRMDTLERTLLAIPSAMPANIANMSSNYGYRRDPFTGAGFDAQRDRFQGATWRTDSGCSNRNRNPRRMAVRIW